MNLKLLVKQGRPAGKALLFAPGEYYFGRGEECDVRFNSEWVSRQHCRLLVKGEQATLSDLGSRNGTLINGQLVQEQRILNNGDQVQIGSVVFQVQFEQPTPEAKGPDKEVIRSAEQDTNEDIVPMNSTAHLEALPPEKAGEKGTPPS